MRRPAATTPLMIRKGPKKEYKPRKGIVILKKKAQVFKQFQQRASK